MFILMLVRTHSYRATKTTMRLAVIVYGSMWKMSSSASALEADVGERARARLGARGGTSQRKRPQLMDLKNGWDLISSAPFNAPRRAVARAGARAAFEGPRSSSTDPCCLH